MALLLWLVAHWEDVEADFRVFYRIEDPIDRPLYEFVAKARRLFYYQGALQYRAMEAQEAQEQDPLQGNVEVRSGHQITRDGVDMRHNWAAAKSAAKGLKGTNAEEVKMVPAVQWMSMVPPGTVEHVEVKA